MKAKCLGTQLKHLPDHVDNMSAALITSSHAPLLLLNDKLEIIAVSESFCGAFDLKKSDIVGKMLAEIGIGEWKVPQLHSLLRATVGGNAAIDIYEMELVRAGRKTCCLLINAHKLDYFETENVRVVLAVTDVTSVRRAEKIKNDLIRDKQLLLQEIQHRVANSLQIIASVLLQSARKVQSHEAREHLHDAHSRVMSIALLQKQLSTVAIDDVGLRDYFTDLCVSLGASMIPNPNHLGLTATVDDSTVDPDTSVSLGLIVTEVVINALKHAFPGRNQAGTINVDYRSDGASWALTIIDDGVGMPKNAKDRKPGLGTGIVEALSTQLNAVFSVTDVNPGTKVSIIHA